MPHPSVTLRALGAVALVVMSSGCAGSRAPDRWLPDAAQMQREAHGGWIEIREGSGSGKRIVEGELIAVGKDSVFVMTHSGLVSRPLAAVTDATLTAFDSHSEDIAAWGIVLSASTASHGAGLLFTAPVGVLGSRAARSKA